MLLTFGRHAGASVELLFFTAPDYLAWAMTEEQPSLALANVAEEARRLMDIFDQRPFVMPCRKCPEPATRCALFLPEGHLCFCCEFCKPYYAFSPGPRFREVHTFQDAYDCFRTRAGGREHDLSEFIVAMARHKGLPAGFGAAEAAAFFDQNTPPKRPHEARRPHPSVQSRRPAHQGKRVSRYTPL
jgi:hypothetical protein